MFDETDIPDWEFEAISQVESRWDISGTEAENFLVNEGVLD
jgi:hypothetical protein